MKKHPSHQSPDPVVPVAPGQESAPDDTTPPTANRTHERIKKSARVDEQIFQEGLSIALDEEKRRQETIKPATRKKLKEDMIRRAEQDSGTIVNEFQSMIDGMLPSAKKERAACLRNAGKGPSAQSKTGRKKAPVKKGGDQKADRATRKKTARKKGRK